VSRIQGRVNATTVLPLSITSVSLQDGQLVANGLLGDNPFTAPLKVSTSPNEENPACPILNLELGPIHLDVLGLVVDTSEICLRVTAEPGGGLLGDLLCGVANLLNGGTPLGTALGGLGDQLDDVLGGITGLLNGVLGQLTSSSAVSGAQGAPGNGGGNGNGNSGNGNGNAGNVTDVLNLSLGPVDLNLLGLDVELDDCEGGPVTVDITAESGPGNLLGNLIGGLAGILDGGGNQNAVNRLVNRIGGVIDGLLA
jgi:hypothetical protein